MENNNVNNTSAAGAAPTPIANEQGRWVAVDSNTVGNIPNNVTANQPFQGADGAMYCVGESQAQLSHINSNMNNAIPVPSSIVQMPPIVQPIALVPFTSQNQPMLQYDPYSRPVDPEVAPKAPSYVKKPYRGISLAALIISIVMGLCFALLSIACFKANAVREAFTSNGVDMILALLVACKVPGLKSNYYNDRILPNLDKMSSDILSAIVVYAVPIFTLIIIIVTIALLIKYIVMFAKKRSPRCFSIGALLNIVLTLSIMGMLLGMSNAEVAIDKRGANIGDFFLLKSGIYSGIGLIISLICSIALLVLPLCAKKNAYMLERTDNGSKTYIIKD